MLDASVLGIAARDRFVRFDVEAKRTGGSGRVGVRLVRPLGHPHQRCVTSLVGQGSVAYRR